MKKIKFTIVILVCAMIDSYGQIGYQFKEKPGQLMGALDIKGKKIIDQKYNHFENKGGFIYANQNLKLSYDLYTTEGKKIGENIDDFRLFESKNFVMLREYNGIGLFSKGKWGLYDIKGNKITNYKYDNLYGTFGLPNHMRVKNKIDNEVYYLLIDSTGKELFQTTDKRAISDYCESLLKKLNIILEDTEMVEDGAKDDKYKIFSDPTTEKYGLKKNSDVIVDTKYDLILSDYFECCELFVVKIENKFGVINKEGTEVLPVKFEKVLDIGYGKVIGKLNNKCIVFDVKTGEALWETKYDYLAFI
jgi:hypothetical protein